jgi:hypothetical protein
MRSFKFIDCVFIVKNFLNKFIGIIHAAIYLKIVFLSPS